MMPKIEQRYEAPRGCGMRKKGGLYMIGGRPNAPCGKLPCELVCCATCGQGFKLFRGWGWIDAVAMLKGKHCDERPCPTRCPLSDAALKERVVWRAGLIWVGEQYYATPSDFLTEARTQGISRRIKALPKNFVLGQTWLFLAHRKACIDKVGNDIPGLFTFFCPDAVEYVIKGTESADQLNRMTERGLTLVDVHPMPAVQTQLPLEEYPS